MSRLTRKIKGNIYYCKYEIKKASYCKLFNLTNNQQIEDNVNCDLTLAIDKLGKLEDIEEQIGCPLEVVWKATNDGFYTIGGKHFTNYMNDRTREQCAIVFRPMKYDNEIVAIVGKNEIGASDTWYEYSTKDYKKTWFLKEDKSE